MRDRSGERKACRPVVLEIMAVVEIVIASSFVVMRMRERDRETET